MMYKIRCYQMHSLYGALTVPYVPVRITCGAAIAHRYTYVPTRLEPSSTAGLSFPCQYLCLTITVFDGLGLAQCLFIDLAARSIFVSNCFLFFVGYCGIVLVYTYCVGIVGQRSSD